MDRRFTQIDDTFIAGDLHQMKLAPNYNKWLYQLVSPFLGQTVLEIGPGIGNITGCILADQKSVVGVEPNAACGAILKQEFGSQASFHLIEKKVEDVANEDVLPYPFDTILCMNVLEHIQDDQAIVSKFRRMLPAKGKLVLLVPAAPFAYGPIDSAVGHFRRYSKRRIQALMKDLFSVEKIFHSNVIGLAGWLYNAKFAKIHTQNDNQIRHFNRLVPLLQFTEKHVHPPIGLSLVCVCIK